MGSRGAGWIGLALSCGAFVLFQAGPSFAKDRLAKNVAERLWRYRDSMDSSAILAQNPEFQMRGGPSSALLATLKQPLLEREVRHRVSVLLGSDWELLGFEKEGDRVLRFLVRSPGKRPILDTEWQALAQSGGLSEAPQAVDFPVLQGEPPNAVAAQKKRGKHRKKPLPEQKPLEDENEIKSDGNCISVLLQNLSRPRPPAPLDLERLLAVPVKGVFRCPELQACTYAPRRRLWAQQQMGGEAARRRLSELGISLQGVKVGVVDDGFDLQGSGQRLDPPVTEVRGQIGWVTPIDREINGNGEHGTMVASFISGRDGVGIAPGVTVQPYLYAGVASVNQVALRAAGEPFGVALRACRDGHRIINLSVGKYKDETGRLEQERESAETLRKLEDEGCLVVMSAGNLGIRVRGSSNPAGDSVSLDDGLLRVGATQSIGGDSAFSTVGEVQAPGAAVMGLLGTQNSSGTRARNRNFGRLLVDQSCEVPPRDPDGNPAQPTESFIDGTSFAAPLTTGVAAMVYAVLNSSPAFVTAPPADRVKLLSRLIAQSQTEDGVNALRAVELANLWKVSAEKKGFGGARDDLRSGGLSAVLAADPRCATSGEEEVISCLQRPEASAPANCTDAIACRERLESLNAICGNDTVRNRALFDLSVETDDLDGALLALRKMVRQEKNVAPFQVSSEFKARLQHLLALYDQKNSFLRSDVLGLDRMTAILALKLEVQSEPMSGAERADLTESLERLLSRDVLERFLGAPDALDRIPSNPQKRSFLNQIQAYADVLGQYRRRVGDEVFLKKLSVWSSKESLTRAVDSGYSGAWILSRLQVLQSLERNSPNSANGEAFRISLNYLTSKVMADVESLEVPIGSLSAVGAGLTLQTVSSLRPKDSRTDFEWMASLWKLGRDATSVNPDQGCGLVLGGQRALVAGEIASANQSLLGVLVHQRLEECKLEATSLSPETRLKLNQGIQSFKEQLLAAPLRPQLLEAVFLRGAGGILSSGEQLDVAVRWMERLKGASPEQMGDLLVENYNGTLDAMNFLARGASLQSSAGQSLSGDLQQRLHDSVQGWYRAFFRSYRQAMAQDTQSALGRAMRNLRQVGDLVFRELISHELTEDWGAPGSNDPNSWLNEVRALKSDLQAHPERYSHFVKNGIQTLEKKLGASL